MLFVKFLHKIYFFCISTCLSSVDLASCVSLYIVLPRHADMPKN